MADLKGSKDGRTWEEMIRKDQTSECFGFCDQQSQFSKGRGVSQEHKIVFRAVCGLL